VTAVSTDDECCVCSWTVAAPVDLRTTGAARGTITRRLLAATSCRRRAASHSTTTRCTRSTPTRSSARSRRSPTSNRTRRRPPRPRRRRHTRHQSAASSSSSSSSPQAHPAPVRVVVAVLHVGAGTPGTSPLRRRRPPRRRRHTRHQSAVPAPRCHSPTQTQPEMSKLRCFSSTPSSRLFVKHYKNKFKSQQKRE